MASQKRPGHLKGENESQFFCPTSVALHRRAEMPLSALRQGQTFLRLSHGEAVLRCLRSRLCLRRLRRRSRHFRHHAGWGTRCRAGTGSRD